MEFAARKACRRNKTKQNQTLQCSNINTGIAFSEILYFSIDDLTFDDDHTS